MDRGKAGTRCSTPCSTRQRARVETQRPLPDARPSGRRASLRGDQRASDLLRVRFGPVCIYRNPRLHRSCGGTRQSFDWRWRGSHPCDTNVSWRWTMPAPPRRASGVMLHGRASASRCSQKLPSRLCLCGPLPRTYVLLGMRPKHPAKVMSLTFTSKDWSEPIRSGLAGAALAHSCTRSWHRST
jgi:hypothetical protein